MSRIISYSIGLNKVAEGDRWCIYLHIVSNRQREEDNHKPYITYITLKELYDMVDFTKEYTLESGFKFIPKYYTNPRGEGYSFEDVVANALTMAYRTGMISADNYVAFAILHYCHHYLTYYKNATRRDVDFFNRYVKDKLDMNMCKHSYSAIVKALIAHTHRFTFDSWDASSSPITYDGIHDFLDCVREMMIETQEPNGETVKIPGKFIKCYYDEFDRKRPITSRVRYEKEFPTPYKFLYVLQNFLHRDGGSINEQK